MWTPPPKPAPLPHSFVDPGFAPPKFAFDTPIDSTNPYAPPNFEQATAERDGRRSNLLWILFSFQGRIPRRTFWAAQIGSAAAMYALLIPIVAAFGEDSPEAEGLSIILGILQYWVAIAASVKRWHDLDKSGWWILINFIPCIGGLWALIETGFFRGTIGDNHYGPDPT